ncbi:MAG: site-2 protease family protein [Deltaproteobacteria bacterium]|nr:site-2 protease family protein [Deltaproteobacteria bacterium]
MHISSDLLLGLPLWFVAFIFSTTCHEAAHALAAKLGGDLTAYEGGQVSLDPTPHIKREPFGMVVVPLVSFLLNGGSFMLGWASTPIDPFWAQRHRKRAAMMSAAGPAANLTLALLAAGGIHLGISLGYFEQPHRVAFDHVVALAGQGSVLAPRFLSVFFSLNLLLGFFNLLPVPPLDGNGVVQLFLDDRLGSRWSELWRGRGAAMMGLLFAWVVFGKLFGPIFLLAINLLYPGASYG